MILSSNLLPGIFLLVLWQRMLLLGSEIHIDQKLSHDGVSKIQSEDMNWSDGIQITEYDG